MSDKITCWLKIRDRGNLDFILKSLNWQLGIFNDTSRYDVVIYSENIELPIEYNSYKIIRKSDLLQNIECRKLFECIQNNSTITPRWMGAYMALSAPYFFDHTNDLIWGLDSDDITIYSNNSKYYIQEAEKQFKELNLKTMSYDMHFSAHIGDYQQRRPHHFSFGLNLSQKDFMKKLILKTMFKSLPDLGFGVNLDYKIDKELETIDTPYIAFVTPGLFSHNWAPHEHAAKTIQYNLHSNKIDARLVDLRATHDKHPRCLLIK